MFIDAQFWDTPIASVILPIACSHITAITLPHDKCCDVKPVRAIPQYITEGGRGGSGYRIELLYYFHICLFVC